MRVVLNNYRKKNVLYTINTFLAVVEIQVGKEICEVFFLTFQEKLRTMVSS